MLAVAPGKLILSGEHAVVYHKPALTLAIDRHIQTKISPSNNHLVRFSLLGKQFNLTFDDLSALKHRVDNQYRLFLNDKCDVSNILNKPEELACYIIADVLENFSIRPNTGFIVHIRSTIPTGCGMGSSAALIVSLLMAAKHYFKLKLADDRLMHRAIVLENLQHGRASGLDIRISLQGGCLYADGQNIIAKTLPQIPLYVINSGAPITTTGECVIQTAKHAKDTLLWEHFGQTTHAIKIAFAENNLLSLKKHIAYNHKLLTDIGVVPAAIQQFIADIECAGGAAKICGAGAIRGDAAGIVLIATDDIDSLQPIFKKYQFSSEPIIPQRKGAHLV